MEPITVMIIRTTIKIRNYSKSGDVVKKQNKQ